MHKTLLIFSLLLSFTCSITYADSQGQAWDYKAKKIKLIGEDGVTATLNRLGQDHWELVNCTKSGTGTLMCIFKRPKK